MIAGVEITSGALRAVCFERFDSRKAPSGVFEVPLPLKPGQGDAPFEGLAKAVAELTRKAGLSSEARVAVTIPSATCLYRIASFPYRSGARISRTLGYALEERVPGSMGDYLIEPVSDMNDAGDAGARVAVAACPVRDVGHILKGFQDAGVDPCVIQPAVVSLLRYVALNESSIGREPILIVRLDVGVCELAWAENGQLFACQTIPLWPEEGAVSHDVETLAERIAFAVRAYQVSDGSAAFGRVVVVESDGMSESLHAALELSLNVRVSTCASGHVEGRWAAAWGVAAEAATRKHAAPTLRRGQYAYRPFALRLERRIAVALVLCLAILWLLGVRTFRDMTTTRLNLASFAEKQRNLFDEMGAASGSLYEVDAILARARETAQTTDRNRVISCIERWRALKELAPAMELMTFEEIDIDQVRVKLTAMARDSNVANGFRDRIAASTTFIPDPYFKQKTIPGKGVSLKMELRYR